MELKIKDSEEIEIFPILRRPVAGVAYGSLYKTILSDITARGFINIVIYD